MKTLICTVGGSHKPIMKAVRDNEPEFVLFVCSDDDASGKAGSYEQIEIGVRKNREEIIPSDPTIPEQLQLADGSYEVIRVFADDLDDAYGKVSTRLSEYVSRGDKVLVDYTGGTKTMSSALCIAAIDFDEVGLQLVTGVRANLHKVTDGTEESQIADIGRTRFKLKSSQALEAWRQHAYDDTIFQLIKNKPSHRDDKAMLTAIREISRAFSLWDRFNHQDAQAILLNLPRYEYFLKPYLTSLRDLTKQGRRKNPCQLFDLWRNAERRAVQQRYDDAVSRVYRLTEWTAQWLLEDQAGFSSGSVPDEKIPEGLALNKNLKGENVASLVQSWILASTHCSSEVGEFWEKNESKLKSWLEVRNNSVLAHGFQPIGFEDWGKVEKFCSASLIPLILSQASKLGIKEMPPQLPKTLDI